LQLQPRMPAVLQYLIQQQARRWAYSGNSAQKVMPPSWAAKSRYSRQMRVERWSRSQMAGLGGTSNPLPPRRRHQATSRVDIRPETHANVTLLGGKGALLKANASRGVLASGRAQGTSIPSPPQRGTRPSAVSASSLNSLHQRGSKSVPRSPTSPLLSNIKKTCKSSTQLYKPVHGDPPDCGHRVEETK